jgi:hypothetical protein
VAEVVLATVEGHVSEIFCCVTAELGSGFSVHVRTWKGAISVRYGKSPGFRPHPGPSGSSRNCFGSKAFRQSERYRI